MGIDDGVADTEGGEAGADDADEHARGRGAAEDEAGGDAGAEVFADGDVEQAGRGDSEVGGGRGVVDFGDDGPGAVVGGGDEDGIVACIYIRGYGGVFRGGAVEGEGADSDENVGNSADALRPTTKTIKTRPAI